jgi:hypothetical protein
LAEYLIVNSPFEKYSFDAKSLQRILAAADIPHGRNCDQSPLVEFEGRRLHSAVDPVREADEWLQSYADSLKKHLQNHEQATIVIVGPGIGYGISAIEKLFRESNIDAEKAKIHCIEACPEIAKKSISLSAWAPTRLEVKWSIVDGNSRLSDYLSDEQTIYIMRGTADYQLRKTIYEAFLSRADSKRNSNSRLRVLVPTPLYGGSLPAAYHSADALRNLGYEVELMDLSEFFVQYEGIEKLTINQFHQKSLKGLYATCTAGTETSRSSVGALVC